MLSPKFSYGLEVAIRSARHHSRAPEGLTDAEINHYLQWTINRVMPRRNEPQKMGLIYDAGRRECRKTHSPAHAYKAKPPATLPPAFEKQEEEPVENRSNSLFD
jgi:hypothetical protein